ncbi:hypothetical protein McanMca71_007224 [Microsporum canis]|uniref:Ankyrin domain-containing protein n=1 Tax=Arthroderma otae (strain ATCC MYA-4605 / CBS 113480) TaxID=554155 RepID=C5FMT3_ARTOC|nr:ankyrin domain-containing protein [Microsporum canis CBS 113480]EEQ31904.1 ankyrin domain-containing protein [Microsporum canis CBS 113480]
MYTPFPEEIWQEIFDHLVLILGPSYKGLRVALKLRLICSFFARGIIRAIHSTQIFREEKLYYYAPESLSSDYLRFQVLRRGQSSNDLINVIRIAARTLRLSNKTPLCDGSENLYNYTTILSEALVKVIPTWEVLRMMLLNNHSPIQHTIDPPDSPRHLISAAACVGNTELVKSLLQTEGISCNYVSSFFGAPLHLAALNGHVDTLKLLLEAGADPNLVNWISWEYKWEEDDIRIYTVTPLNFACLSGKWEIIRILSLPEYNIPVTDIHYQYAILNAVKGGHSDIVSYLLDKADLSSVPETTVYQFWYRTLRVACAHGSIDVVKVLLNRGVSVHKISGSRVLEPPLSITAGLGYYEIMTILLEKGADPNRRSLIRDTVPLLSCSFTKAAKYGFVKSFQMLMDYTKQTRHHKEVIHYAARSGQEHVIRYLAVTGIWSSLCGGKDKEVAEEAVKYASDQGYPWVGSLLAELGLLEPQ